MTPEAAARLPPPADGLQVNRCKSPHCPHFGVAPDPSSDARPPPRHGYGPTAFYDGRYAIGAAGARYAKSTQPTLECLGCGESPPLKSNRAIVAERRRLEGADAAPAAPPGAPRGCPNPDCRQRGRAPDAHPEGYARGGKTGAGTQRLECKACGRRFAARPRPPGPRRVSWLYEELLALRLCADHMPFRKILRRTGLGAGRFYDLLARGAQAARALFRANTGMTGLFHSYKSDAVTTLECVAAGEVPCP